MTQKMLFLLFITTLSTSLQCASSYGATTIEYNDDDDDQSYTVQEEEIITQKKMLCKKFDTEKTLSWTEFSLYYICQTLLDRSTGTKTKKLYEHAFLSLTYKPTTCFWEQKTMSRADITERKTLKLRLQNIIETPEMKPQTYAEKTTACILAACLAAPKDSAEYSRLKKLYYNLTNLIVQPFQPCHLVPHVPGLIFPPEQPSTFS